MSNHSGGGHLAYRIERDSMGEVRVPQAAKWRAQTQRAIENFPISGVLVNRELIHALARIKGAAAVVKSRRGMQEPELAQAISEAAAEIVTGRWDEQFPLDVYQTGSGTSTNMNLNEVIASVAAERLGASVHPNDDVNDPLSSNDQFPSAIHIAAVRLVSQELTPALVHLAEAWEHKAIEFADAVKSGRTHLMDATPVTLGQEFGGYAAAIRFGIDRLEDTLPRVGQLPLGGTAVGTGINAPAGYAHELIAELAHDLQLPLAEAADHFEAQGSRDALVELSGQLRTIAVSLYKSANDLRWMSSGPLTGLAEIRLPDLQPGSSIMPGKVNPVIPEAVCQVVAQVIGNDAAVAFGGAAGNLELNVMLPVIGRNLLESIAILAAVSRLYADRCIEGISADRERMLRFAESSPSIVTPLNHLIGYDEAAKVAKQAVEEGRTIRETVIARGLVDAGKLTLEQLDAALDVLSMTHPDQG